MRKFLGIAAVLVIVLVMGLSTASSALPAAKATAAVANFTILDETAEDVAWTTILDNTLKTPNQKDLFIDVSLECGLYTETRVKSYTGVAGSASAEASVQVQVLVDGAPAYPGEVIFCKRTQELTALFGGILEACTDANGDGIITSGECTWLPEELELVLDTMNANAFNFVLDDLGPGEHLIQVQARIDNEIGVDDLSGSTAKAMATIGKGSVTVEEVRMIKGEDVLEMP